MKAFKKALALFLSLSTLQAHAQVKVLLKGNVIDRNSKSIYLFPRTEDFRSKKKIEIPIRNNRFEYELHATELEAYELIFRDDMENGTLNATIFFPDTSVISLLLHAPPLRKNDRIDGGGINRYYYRIKEEQKKHFDAANQVLSKAAANLREKQLFYTAERDSLVAKILRTKTQEQKLPLLQAMERMRKTGEDLSPQGQQWQLQYDSLTKEMISWKYTRIDNDVNLANYYSIFEDMLYYAKNNLFITTAIQAVYQKYMQAFPEHTYTTRLKDGLGALLHVFPGKPFINVSAPDLAGNQHELHNLIKGKLAIIDLWGSWCSPCIIKSRKIVPLYEKYKHKNFTVVGIAREFGNTKDLVNRLSKEQFNWIQLLELDDKQGIWNKYGIPNSGGMILLVGTDGNILSIDPTVEELEKHLHLL